MPYTKITALRMRSAPATCGAPMTTASFGASAKNAAARAVEQRDVHNERASEGSRFAAGRSNDCATHALNRRADDGIVRDARDRKRRSERAIAVEPDDSRQRDLLHETGDDEVDFRERDGETAAPRNTRNIGRNGRAGGFGIEPVVGHGAPPCAGKRLNAKSLDPREQAP